MTKVSARSASQRLADHVFDLRYEDLPPEVVAKVKTLLVHHLGLAFQGSLSEDGRRAVDLAAELTGAAGTSTIIGGTRRGGLIDAVFANAFLMSHNGLDDFTMPGGLHPGVTVQPAAWAVGEHCASSGQELIVAVVAGYDTMGKLANTVWTWGEESPRRPNAIFAPFGAAAAAARLLSLSRAQVVDALGHAAQSGMGIIEGSDFPWVIHQLLARNGVMAAVLAQGGFPTAPTMIEGEHGVFRSYFGQVPDSLDASLASLGHEFEVGKASTKRYRASGLNIVPMQLMLDLVQRHGLHPKDVQRVDVALPLGRRERERVWETARNRSGATSSSRAGSLRFQLAIILADGTIDAARCDVPADELVSELIENVHLHFEPQAEVRYARIEVTTTDGTRHTAEAHDYTLPPVDPLEWLRAAGRDVVGDEQVARLAELIAKLEDVEDVSEVLACTVPNDAPAPRP